ncbi:MAG: hypothetical protein ACFCU3_06475 [Verrucomicrobiales bacterium]
MTNPASPKKLNGHKQSMALSVVCVAFLLAQIATPAGAQDRAYSQISGYMNLDIPPNSITVQSFPILATPIFSGRIASNVGGAISLDIPGEAVDIGELLLSNDSYYLEIHNPEGLEGHRFDIDVAATQQASTNSIVLSTAAGNHNTLQAIPSLAGASFHLRPHWTLAKIFGTGMSGATMDSSADFSQADQVWVWIGRRVSVFWFRQNSANTIRNWRNVDTGITNQDGFVIPPGDAVMVKRQSVEEGIQLQLVGDVRQNRLIQNLAQGISLIASGYPIDLSPVALDYDNLAGFTSATGFDVADQIWTWTGRGVSVYWYRENTAGTIRGWRNVSTGIQDQSSTSFIMGGSGVFVQLNSQISAHTFALPFSLE